MDSLDFSKEFHQLSTMNLLIQDYKVVGITIISCKNIITSHNFIDFDMQLGHYCYSFVIYTIIKLFISNFVNFNFKKSVDSSLLYQ